LTTKKPVEQEYNADALITLDPIVHIQKRPSLTLGPFDRMQLVALREPIDNSIDEYRAGHGKELRITLLPDGSAQIEDSGRGVPTGINKQTGENGIYMAFGKVGSGGKFGAASSGYSSSASLGLNGIGTTATNATASRFDTIVFRAGKKFRLSFKDGKPGHFSDDNGPTDKFTPSMDIVESKDTRSAKEKAARPSGTTIKFWPNPAIFGNDSSFRVDELRELLRSSAFLVAGIRIIIDDKSVVGAEQIDEFEFDGGIVEMLSVVAPDEALHETIHINSSGSFSETVPVPQADGTVKPELVERKVEVNVALRWGTGYEATQKSFVNTISTPLHGTHVTGVERALSKTLTDYIKTSRGLLKAKEEIPNMDDIKEGLTAIISINQNEPSFVGQEKARLGGTETQKVVQAVMLEQLAGWINNRKNAAVIKLIATKVVNASRIRLAQRDQKDTARRKTSLESASMPSKLIDCSEVNTEFSELHICEGDSALGTMKMARDSRFQALLPIRGKIINVQKASLKDTLDNAECAAIIQVMGAGSGRTFEVDQMRYHNVGIAVDADVDGAHIRTLLITFFWKYMRPMVEAGRLYATMPPLYVLKTIGKNAEIFYLDSDDERDKLMARLDKAGRKYEPLQRLKGLGEMDAEEFWETTLNPETRSLRRITVEDAVASEKMLDLAMGPNVEPRKDWIIESRAKISQEELDV
jgi:DNA gyrase subunit B